MKTIVVAGAMLAGSVFAAVPVIDPASISARQDGGHTVVIGYTMNPATDGDTDPAIITVDVLTNYTENAEVKWASIGGEHLTTLSGDVNKIVSHTANYKHNILWDPTKEGLPKLKFNENEVKVEITAWATNSPPAYWVIDLGGDGAANARDRSFDRYYPEVGQIPGGVTNDIYKTMKLVFRRVPAKGVTWKMGNPNSTGATLADKCYDSLHYVSFSYDYYLAVYELTQRQIYRMTMTHQYPAPNPADGNAAKPFTQNYASYRDTDWPAAGHGTVGSKYIARMRSGTGIKVDFPTESEWEFACRAGTDTIYNNGESTNANLGDIAWYASNSGGALHEVGTREPNRWGFYDMHGNVHEHCLDWRSYKTSEPLWDPTGPLQADIQSTYGNVNYKAQRILRGGYYGSSAADCGSGIITASRASNNDVGSLGGGARLCVLIP